MTRDIFINGRGWVVAGLPTVIPDPAIEMRAMVDSIFDGFEEKKKGSLYDSAIFLAGFFCAGPSPLRIGCAMRLPRRFCALAGVRARSAGIMTRHSIHAGPWVDDPNGNFSFLMDCMVVAGSIERFTHDDGEARYGPKGFVYSGEPILLPGTVDLKPFIAEARGKMISIKANAATTPAQPKTVTRPNGLATDFDWTPEACATLSQLWDAGLTASEIAKRMDITKNAVVGKARRLELRPRRETKTERTARLTMNEQQATDRTGYVGIWPPHGHCLWPHGEPKDADFHFCGEKAVEGKPYCESHCKRAYGANTWTDEERQAHALKIKAAKESKARERASAA